MDESGPLLKIENLNVRFSHRGKSVHALRRIDISFYKDEIHGLVGESGSGKTVTATSIMGLLPRPSAEIISGSVFYKGKNLLLMPEDELRTYRGRAISMVFQEPAKYLNPAFKIGGQIEEMVMLHMGLSKVAARARARELLKLVGLGRDGRVLDAYPHELSSGMKQRAMIAIAISCNPDFLIADEPTTALDVTLQKQILKLIRTLKNIENMGVLFISHDLGVIREIADRISVIYAGKIVESAGKESLFNKPMHPYTRLLMLSIPDARHRGRKLATIPGQVLDTTSTPEGCLFAPRCPLAEQRCFSLTPELVEHEKGHLAACHFAGKSWNL
jgi:oligopeptide/dipeptide ABC transporter ATP-binding protein